MKEVEVVKSVHDLLTSQWSEGHEFHDFEMLDAKIVSALKMTSWIGTSQEEWMWKSSMLKNTTDFFDGDRLLTWSTIIFGLWCCSWSSSWSIRSIQCVSTRSWQSGFRYKMRPSSIICIWSTQGNVLDSMYKMRLCESVQLQTVLAAYDQEIDWGRAMPSSKILKTMVRRHIDQNDQDAQLQSPKWKDRNRSIGQGKNVSVWRRLAEGHQWKANGQYSRGDSCSFRHGSDRGQPAQSSSADGRKHSKDIGARRER